MPVRTSEAEDARRMELYKRGLSDVQIAREFGLTNSAISHWRRMKELPPNQRGNLISLPESELTVAYGQGLNDEEIGRKFGVCKWVIRNWRYKKGLASKHRLARINERKLERLRELHAQGKTDVQIARELGCAITTIDKYRRGLGLGPNFQPGGQPVIKHQRVAKAIIEISETLPKLKRAMNRRYIKQEFKVEILHYWQVLANRLSFLALKLPDLAQEMGYELDGMSGLMQQRKKARGGS